MKLFLPRTFSTAETVRELAKQVDDAFQVLERSLQLPEVSGRNSEKGSGGNGTGTPGTPGAPGRGISSVTISDEDHLIIGYTDGTTTDAGEVTCDCVNTALELLVSSTSAEFLTNSEETDFLYAS